MGVHRDALPAPERVAADHGGGLAAHAGEAHELLRPARHVAPVTLEYGERRAAQRARLLVVEASLEDRLCDLALVGVGKRLRAGVPANSSGVTRLTRSSVVWAERIVATSSSHGVVKSSEVRASGYAWRRRRRIARTRRSGRRTA